MEAKSNLQRLEPGIAAQRPPVLASSSKIDWGEGRERKGVLILSITPLTSNFGHQMKVPPPLLPSLSSPATLEDLFGVDSDRVWFR